MRERIEAHRARAARWPGARSRSRSPSRRRCALAGDEFAIVDCLSLWVSNLLEHTGVAAIEVLAREAATLAAVHPGGCVAVSNEVGMGIVPANALARAYRDVLGRVNAIWAEAAEDALFAVSGRVLRLERT